MLGWGGPAGGAVWGQYGRGGRMGGAHLPLLPTCLARPKGERRGWHPDSSEGWPPKKVFKNFPTAKVVFCNYILFFHTQKTATKKTLKKRRRHLCLKLKWMKFSALPISSSVQRLPWAQERTDMAGLCLLSLTPCKPQSSKFKTLNIGWQWKIQIVTTTVFKLLIWNTFGWQLQYKLSQPSMGVSMYIELC